jgi:hypothetical protein
VIVLLLYFSGFPMYHILVWLAEVHEYHLPLLVHFLTNAKIPPEEALNRAMTLAKSEFSYKEINYIKSVSYEYLPISIDGEVTVVANHEWRGLLVEYRVFGSTSNVDEIVKNRLKFLTFYVDRICRDAIYIPIDYLMRLKTEGVIKDFRVFKISNDYYIRAEPSKPLTIDEVIKLRNGYDDEDRITIDMAYHKNSLDFLVNMLPEEVCEYSDGKFVCYDAVEVPLNKLMIRRSGSVWLHCIREKFKTSFNVMNINVDVDVDVYFRISTTGPANILTKEFEKELENIMNEYIDNKKIFDEVIEFYRRVGIDLRNNELDVLVYGNKVYLVTNRVFGLGRLIGKNGRNVKMLESKLGREVVIMGTDDKRITTLLTELARMIVLKAYNNVMKKTFNLQNTSNNEISSRIARNTYLTVHT